MTDLETSLRQHLHDSLDPLQPGPAFSENVVRAGQRQRRRRLGAALSVAVLLLGTGSAALLTRHKDNPRTQLASSLGNRSLDYATALARGEVETVREAMTPSVKTSLSADLLRTGWREVESAYGRVRSIGTAVHEGGSLDTWRVPVTLDRGSVNIRLTYDEAGRVIGVTVLTAGATSNSPLLEPATRQLVADLAAGRFDAAGARFDARMRSALPVDTLRRGWQDAAVRNHGGFLRIAGITTLHVNGSTVQRALCDMQRGQLVVQVAYNDSGQITGLFLLEK